jgi:hypothetical protein
MWDETMTEAVKLKQFYHMLGSRQFKAAVNKCDNTSFGIVVTMVISTI